MTPYSPPEGTRCDDGGRDTPTATDGVCVECWTLKEARPGRFPIYEPRRDASGADPDAVATGVIDGVLRLLGRMVTWTSG